MSKTWPRKPALTATAVLLGCLTYSGQAQAQNLFEFLFGGRPQPTYQQPQYQPQQYERSEPMEMRVNPRRNRKELAGRGERAARSDRREHGARPNPVQTVRRASKPVVAAARIDPKTNPNWHLIDPTLRKGDVVVLKGQILVFDGGSAPATRDSFATLKESRHLSATERQQIEKIAALPDGSAGTKQTQASLTTGTLAANAAKPAEVALAATE